MLTSIVTSFKIRNKLFDRFGSLSDLTISVERNILLFKLQIESLFWDVLLRYFLNAIEFHHLSDSDAQWYHVAPEALQKSITRISLLYFRMIYRNFDMESKYIQKYILEWWNVIISEIGKLRLFRVTHGDVDDHLLDIFPYELSVILWISLLST